MSKLRAVEQMPGLSGQKREAPAIIFLWVDNYCRTRDEQVVTCRVLAGDIFNIFHMKVARNDGFGDITLGICHGSEAAY